MRPIRLNDLLRFLKRCWLPLAIFIVLIAVISSLFRALTPWVKQYKPEIEQHLSVLLGNPVTISTMETSWYWFEPVIKLNQVSISNGSTDSVQLKKLLVGINLLSSLWHWQIQPGILYVDDLNLTFRQEGKQWRIDGLEVTGKPRVTFDNTSYSQALAWILAQQKIIFHHVVAQIYMDDGTLIPIKQLNLNVVRNFNHYHIQGNAYLDQATPTSITVLANMVLDADNLKTSNGEIYLAVDNLALKPWQSFFSGSRFSASDGKGNLQLWMGLKSGQIQTAQSKLNFNQLTMHDRIMNQTLYFDQLKANTAWHTIKNGWELTADQINLEFEKKLWPENKVVVRYQKDKNTFYVYVQHLLIEPLMTITAGQVESLSSVASRYPHGYLTDMQFQLTNNTLSYLLTRFTQLGWKAQSSLPGIENLSGVLNWQPSEGHLAIDSDNTTIQLPAKQPVVLNGLNAEFQWKELSHGLRVSMDHLVVNHPDLLISATGAVDELTRDSAGQITLSGQVSANNAQQWLMYLPAKHLKAKLDRWLKQDIKRIDKVVADIKVNGLATDFPFDKQPGDFIINAHAFGVDLIFAPHWPMIKDIEAFLQVNKRLLNVDIVHGNVNGNVIDNGNIRVADIGYDREVFLLHTLVNANAKKALDYMMASPLVKKLSVLKMLEILGQVNLDLRVEAPLYPENNDILVLGDLTFNDNKIIVKHAFDDVELTDLKGALQFDQKGIIDSSLNANLMDYPITLLIKSVRDANPYTQVKIQGKTTIHVLRERLALPIFSLMHGDLWLESVLTLTDNPDDLERLTIQTSLQGMAIDLPPPLGKDSSSIAPLALTIDFNPDKAVKVHLDYHQQLSSDLSFSGSKRKFQFIQGTIHLGKDKLVWQEKPGLHIVGILPTFDLAQWQRVLKKLSPPSSNPSNDVLQSINLLFKQATIGIRHYNEVAIKASKQSADHWAIDVNQADVAGKLFYQPIRNYLSGHFTRLHISDKLIQDNESASALTIKAMPSVDLSIDDLNISALDLGSASIKAIAMAHQWQMDSFKISSPYYQLTGKGYWSEEKKQNSTQIEANLSINNLGKALQRFNISPVVEAHQGQLQFQGGWSGGIQQFSLTNIAGRMAISFKNGRITHLSPETESKLGLGKLLSILSLQTIPRRLTLDFSDLSNSGYSFDEFKGNFVLAKGLMSTDDSYIDGPIAYASMKGNLDIARQRYDLDLHVAPHVTASLPIVATIAGGPIAGLATWVVSKIINKGMQKISGYTYKISGPWKQPVVHQLAIIKKTDAIN